MNLFTLGVPLESIVCYSHTFENNLGTKKKFGKYLKQDCGLASDKHFFLQKIQIYFQNNQACFGRPEGEWVNTLMLTAAKTSLTILMKSFRLKQNWQSFLRRNVHQNIINNSPSNILKNYSQFKSYRQKYRRSRRQFLEEL